MTMFAWLLTYLIHSTVLLGLVWLVTRRRRLEPAVSELLWKVAILAGLVTGAIQSRQYHYRAAVTEQEVQHSMVGELTERLFDGDVTALVQHLLNGADVSPGDLAKIRDMIEHVETNAPETK